MQLVFIHSAHVQARMRYLIPKGRGKINLTVRYGFVEHPQYGPMLVDTGYVSDNIDTPRNVFLKFYYMLLRPKPIAAGQIDAALARYGYIKEDINVIMLSHFHVDHIAALQNFSNAKIMCSKQAYMGLCAQSSWRKICHGHFLSLLPDNFMKRLEFFEDFPLIATAKGLEGHDVFGDQSIIAVKLSGHTLDHFGFCFPKIDTPLLYAADAHWLNEVISKDRAFSFPVKHILHDYQEAMDSLTMINHFQQQGGMVVLCHDPAITQYDEVL